jgi:hypothetical protein
MTVQQSRLPHAACRNDCGQKDDDPVKQDRLPGLRRAGRLGRRRLPGFLILDGRKFQRGQMGVRNLSVKPLTGKQVAAICPSLRQNRRLTSMPWRLHQRGPRFPARKFSWFTASHIPSRGSTPHASAFQTKSVSLISPDSGVTLNSMSPAPRDGRRPSRRLCEMLLKESGNLRDLASIQ